MPYATTDQPLDLGERPRGAVVHILMPCMVYACGGSVLDPDAGHFVLSVYDDREWKRVTCPACREPGRDGIRAEQRRQQGRQS